MPPYCLVLRKRDVHHLIIQVSCRGDKRFSLTRQFHGDIFRSAFPMRIPTICKDRFFMRRNLFLVSTGALLIAAGAQGQLADEFNPPRANCCLINNARGLADQLQDWNQLGRYHQANEELKKQAAESKRVVFMGDSITDFWRLDQYFPGKPYVNRGIGGQTTPQMLVRMYPDVIELKPAAMVLLAGTNDIAGKTERKSVV